MAKERKPLQASSWLASLARFRRTGPSAAADDATDAWRKTVRRRVFVASVGIVLWMTGVQARLVYLQVVRHDKYAADAARQQESVLRPEAPRGDILDRNGRIMAFSVDADSIYADPAMVRDAADTTARICAALGDCTARERTDLQRKLEGPGRFAYVRRSRQVSPEQVARVAALDLPGVGFQRDTGRYYPLGSLGAHVVGFVNQDNRGQAGIEQAYDKTIRGEAGLAYAQVDARRHRVQTRVDREPIPGATIELTLDLHLQHLLERELRAGIEASRAAAGTAIIMDPHTGEILAMASYPTFNPNVVNRATPDERRFRATQDVYEPGSTFKIVTAAAAIEEGIVEPDDMVDTNPGRYYIVGRKPITEASGHNYGVLTFEDAIIKSSNVGAIKVGLRTGADRITRYVHRFGFGETIAPDFPGQSRGIWNPRNLNESGLASVSMGYQVSVTPLQMAAAVSAVANGGLLMEPRIVRAVRRDGTREVVAPKVLRRAITSETAATVRRIMEGVVSRGTARVAQIEGYPAAGKTGTAHKVAENGGYSRSDYNASFVGFVPARNPEFTILVVIDTPRTSIYGGVVAAPVFRRIAEAALQYRGVPAEVQQPVPVTPLRAAYTARPRPRPEVMPTPVSFTGGAALMPDVRGLSGREAVRVLARVGIVARVTGSGFVHEQTPAAGTPVDTDTVGRLALQRDPDPPANSREASR
jgi:cell division protein FtsI (penicillin-binding protein 3)